MEKLKYIAGRFALSGNILEVSPLGEGLINDTYIVRTDGNDDYVLQRINHSIFKDVELLQRNIEFVTSHIRTRLETSGADDIERKVLEFIRLKDSDLTFYHDGSSYWLLSLENRHSLRRQNSASPCQDLSRTGRFRPCHKAYC